MRSSRRGVSIQVDARRRPPRPPEPAPSSGVHRGVRGGDAASAGTWAHGRGVGARPTAVPGRSAGAPHAVGERGVLRTALRSVRLSPQARPTSSPTAPRWARQRLRRPTRPLTARGRAHVLRDPTWSSSDGLHHDPQQRRPGSSGPSGRRRRRYERVGGYASRGCWSRRIRPSPTSTRRVSLA